MRKVVNTFLTAFWIIGFAGWVFSAYGQSGGASFSQSGERTGPNTDPRSDIARNGSTRTHVPLSPTTGHEVSGRPTPLVVSGTVVVRPGEETGVFRSGPRAVVLVEGSLVGTTLTGDVLAAGETDAEGNFTLVVPAGTGEVVISANKDPLELKAVVTRLPSEGTLVDADSATVAVLTLQGITAVGTELDLAALVDSLNTQVERETSLLSEMAQVNQAIIDELIGSGPARTRGAPVRTLNSAEAFDLFMTGDFASDETVGSVVRTEGVDRNRVVAVRSTVLSSFRAGAGLEAHRTLLTEEQFGQLDSAFRTGIRASNVNDSVEDSLVTTCFYSYIQWTLGEIRAAAEEGLRQRPGSAAAALTSVSVIGERLANAVEQSQSSQTLLGEQYDFSAMLNDFTFNHARQMSQMGMEQDQMVVFMENMTQMVILDLLEGTGSNAHDVLDGTLQSARSAMADAEMAPERIESMIQNLETSLRSVAEGKVVEHQTQTR